MRTLLSAAILAGCSAATAAVAHATDVVSLDFLGRYETGIFDDSAAEIVAYNAWTNRAFVTNAAENSIDVLSLDDPANPALAFSIDLDPYGAGVNSVAVGRYGLVAVAVEADVKQDNGSVVFFDLDGNYINRVTVGAMPDMVTFTPNGRFVLTANEGEPNDDYTVDPEGSVSVIRIPWWGAWWIRPRHVRTADFTRFDTQGVPEGVRVFGPGATPSQDLEPEYIAVNRRSRTAYVVCQENNAMAIVNIRRAKVTRLVALGTKDHNQVGNGIDPSNRDDAISIANWPVRGMYLPDAIASYSFAGKTFIVSANEGDARDYDGFSEEERVKDLDLDPEAFPNAAALQLQENLGRLKTTTTLGDTDNDGDYDEIYSYGARSISIWDAKGKLVWDSGDTMEQVLAGRIPDDFNSTNDENGSFDNRSDDKGPEPEAIAIATINGSTYAFCGLERVGGIMIFDISNPYNASYAGYATSRDFTGDAEAGTAGDLGPEGIAIVKAAESPTGKTLLVVSHEVSGTTAVYEFNDGLGLYGDINDDGVVNFDDIFALLDSLGPCNDCPADLNRDGRVNRKDFRLLLRVIYGG